MDLGKCWHHAKNDNTVLWLLEGEHQMLLQFIDLVKHIHVKNCLKFHDKPSKRHQDIPGWDHSGVQADVFIPRATL